jgi:hypothetical protein
MSFPESSSPKPLKITQVSFRYFRNLIKYASGVIATGGKFTSAGVIDTGSKFATGIVDIGGNHLILRMGTISDCIKP